MFVGLDGDLIASELAESTLSARVGARLKTPDRRTSQTWIRQWRQGCLASLGPASPVRAILDRGAAPLFGRLGFDTATSHVTPRAEGWLSAWLTGSGIDGIPLVVGRWSESLTSLRAGAIRHGALPNTHWCLGFNGRYVIIVDTRRAFARAHLSFDLEVALEDPLTFDLLWALLQRDAFATEGAEAPLIDRLVARSHAHRVAVCESLHRGVLDALQDLVDALASGSGRRPTPASDLPRLFEQALTLIYRILFLLFAEARQLVPSWHPTYRDGYTIESLRRAMTHPDAPVPGLWEALAAIGRLADRGCNTPDLRVTAFDGRLFSRAADPTAPVGRLDDRKATSALNALTTSPAAGGGVRPIAYADLGVEQLGSVYERVLEYRAYVRPSSTSGRAAHDPAGGLELRGTSGRRKATSSYYTPRSITDYIVRRSLAPLAGC